jgi:hypothetical protein
MQQLADQTSEVTLQTGKLESDFVFYDAPSAKLTIHKVKHPPSSTVPVLTLVKFSRRTTLTGFRTGI